MLSPNLSERSSVDSEPIKYAKLARPRLHEALARERLFARLDALRARHRVLWIAAPPGAGKTTLAASYLVARKVPDLWCQIDQGDVDPSTLFFFLSEAIGSGAVASSWLAPEMGNEPARMQRMFFRDFYTRLPQGAVVVLDNLHEFDWEHAGDLLEVAFAEVPDGIHVFCLSRDAMPARLARMEMDGRLCTLGWNELRFDDAEALALAGQGEGEGGAALDPAWLARIDGWAAGVVMLRSLKSQPGQASEMGEGRDALFRYFAGEILERMPAPWQHLLMLLSCLPGISAADAEVLTGDAAAIRLLNQLYHNRLFVERRGTTVQTYHFHGLFREFLRYEARQRLDANERAAFIERAAAILDAHGQCEEAAQLYQEAGAHQQLLALLQRRANLMLSTGRAQAWREWMSWLPPDVSEGVPWLRYWHGVSLSHVAPLLARKILVRAAGMFAAEGDAVARLLTIAAIIDSYDFDWAEFKALSGWIEQMLELLASVEVDALEPDIDLKIHSRLTLALLLSGSGAAHLNAAAQRSLQLLNQVNDRVEQLAVGAILLRYFDSVDNPATANWLVDTVSKLADDSGLSPFHRAWWYARVARWLSKDGNFDQAQQVAGTAKTIVANFDLDPLMLQFLDIHHLLGTGDIAAAGVLIEQARRTVPPDRVRDCIELCTLDAHWHGMSGDVAGARACATDAIGRSVDAGMPANDRSHLEVFLAACHAIEGDHEGARWWCEQAEAHAFSHEATIAREAGLLVAAYASQVRDNDAHAADALLREALGLHRRRQSSTLFTMLPSFAAAVAALALAADIEVEHVRAIIVRQRLQAPQRFTPNWPWPVAVHTFGKFDLALSGELFSPSGKAQQRPLLLLKALLAAGEGGKSQQSLAAHLWPDADDAKSALNVTVHRLRKLLASDAAVLVGAGKVVLATAVVWSDAATLVDLCDRIDQLASDAPTAEVNALAASLLHIYRGPFCDGDDDAWLLAARERLRNRFLTAAASLGARLEEHGQWTAARHIYLRSLEAEPLAEISYRGQMRCAHALGDPTAAFSAYRRCRETLSIVLGHQPSAETEKLAVALGLK